MSKKRTKNDIGFPFELYIFIIRSKELNSIIFFSWFCKLNTMRIYINAGEFCWNLFFVAIFFSQIEIISPFFFASLKIDLNPQVVILWPPRHLLIKSSSFIFSLISSNGISSLSNNSFWYDRLERSKLIEF